MRWPCSRRSASGPPAWSLCRPSPGADADASLRARGARPITGRSRPRRWRYAAAGGLARGVLARGLQPNPDLALRRRADTARHARRQAHGPTTARMAADRVARGRARADQILALDLARRHSDRSSRRYRETALAHRTRL